VAIPLSTMARRANPRKREIVLRPVTLPTTLASDLYAAAYAPIVNAWTEAEARIMAEYERSLAELTTDSPQSIGDVLASIEGGLAKLILTVRLRIGDWGAKAERTHRAKWRGAVKAATKVDIGTMIGPEAARIPLGMAIERNVGLVKSVSDQTRQRIGEAVLRGLNARKPAREVAKEISEATGMARRRALNVAADQTVKITAQLNTNRAIEAGLEYYEWVHSGKLHPREEHRARNGQRFKYGEPSGDEPSDAPFCGCTARACLTLDGEF
jgi:SPP1 gp7 family putative phage head morphogenesis protein